MKIEKAAWSTDGDSVRLTMPLQKVDTEKRIVSGFATLDNEDMHGDIVTKEASRKAFERFRGNLRLMHQPIPAGRLVNFREEEYYDQDTNKFYSGIYVDAYVSEGADNVWKMVLDGTLTGFSIGGNVVDAESQFVKDANKVVRFIKDYEMVELSLVDNPANQLSNIFSIQKNADGGQEVEGMIAKVSIENVFYCKSGHEPVTIIGSDTTKSCVDCGNKMRNIGWFESTDSDRAEKVNGIITKFEADSTEGGENMAKNKENTETPADEATTVESTEEVSPKGDSEVIAPEEGTEEAKTATNVEEEAVTVTGTGAAKVDEAKEVVQPEFEDGKTVPGGEAVTKALDEFTATITSALEKNSAQTSEAIATVTANFEKSLAELATKHEELSNKFSTLTDKLDGVEKGLEAVEKSGAMKKSADLGGSEEVALKKSNSKWGGAFLSVGQLG